MISRNLLWMTMLPPSVRTQAARRLRHRASTLNIRSLVRSLSDEEASVREAALESLVSLGTQGVDGLVQEFLTPSQSVRTQIASALGQFESHKASAITALEPMLRDPSSSVRAAAADSIGKLGTASGTAIAALSRVAAQGNDIESVAESLRALGRIGIKAQPTMPIIVSRLKDDDRTIRQAAAEAFAGLCESSHLDSSDIEFPPELIQLLFHLDPGVREASARACGSMGQAARVALPALMQQIPDGNVAVRRAAVSAIIRVAPGEARTLSLLITMTQDKEWSIREEAVKGFIPFGSAAHHAIPRLKIMLNDEYARVRQAALEAVAAIGAPARFLVNSIYERLFDKHESTRPIAMATLCQLAPYLSDFVSVLIQELDAMEADRRRTAIEVIGVFGEHAESAMPRVLEALYDTSLSVREAASVLTGQPVPLGQRR